MKIISGICGRRAKTKRVSTTIVREKFEMSKGAGAIGKVVISVFHQLS